MIYSQSEIEALLESLRQNQTESPTVDGKANIYFDTNGDRAFFIRHIAALGNNVEPSCLIIGVENKTWNLIGLSEDSPLYDADNAQHRLNKILANRLDPNLSVRYRTYEVSGVVIGVVTIEGKRAPYIVAIEDHEYGGPRTRGEPSYIYRGVVYVRHGSNSVIANRQSEISHIIDVVQQTTTNDNKLDDYLAKNNYLDPSLSNFGHHQLTERLVEIYFKPDSSGIEQIPAQTWVSFLLHPIDGNCEIDTVALKAKLKPDQRIGREGKWYHGIPRNLLEILWEPRATPRELIGSGTWLPPQRGQPKAQEITHFIRISPLGYIEFCCTDPLVNLHNDIKYFTFVGLIGSLWQFIYFAKAIYQDVSFYGKIAVLLNLVGTHKTILADFAKSRQGGWRSPFDDYFPMNHTLEQEMCDDPNIQIEQIITIANISDEEIEAKVREIAKAVGSYYGQDRPRCFDFHTDEFPFRDYRA